MLVPTHKSCSVPVGLCCTCAVQQILTDQPVYLPCPSVCPCYCFLLTAQQWFYDAQRRLHPYAAADKCLQVPNSNTANSVGLTIQTCATTNNHVWASATAGLLPAMPAFPNNGRIQTVLNGMCADVFSFNYQNTAPIVTFQCNTQNNQKWQWDVRGQLRSTHNTAKCMDASTPNTGAPLGGWR